MIVHKLALHGHSAALFWRGKSTANISLMGAGLALVVKGRGDGEPVADAFYGDAEPFFLVSMMP